MPVCAVSSIVCSDLPKGKGTETPIEAAQYILDLANEELSGTSVNPTDLKNFCMQDIPDIPPSCVLPLEASSCVRADRCTSSAVRDYPTSPNNNPAISSSAHYDLRSGAHERIVDDLEAFDFELYTEPS